MAMEIITIGFSVLFMLLNIGVVSADMAKDREECASQLVGLATCLPYVSGTAKAPTLDCCTGLKQVLGGKSKKCLCILVKDRNDPQLGLNINATLALGLPTTCHLPSNVSDCPALLNLAPKSPDAQVFEQFANSTKGTASAPPSNAKGTSSNANEKSDGSSLKRLSGIDAVVGTMIWSLTFFFFKGFY